jgi:hypothetical protein
LTDFLETRGLEGRLSSLGPEATSDVR